MASKSSAKYLSKAAPVGVHNSPLMLPEYEGTSLKIYAVAGAGTGKIP